MARKTISVGEVKERVNHLLSVPNQDLWTNAPGKDREMTPEEAFRMGAASVLESILMSTGNYQGFGYRDIQRDSDDNPVIPDETRRVYR